MKTCWSFLVRMSLNLRESLPNNSVPIWKIRVLKSPKLLTPPTNPSFHTSSLPPRAWKIWTGAFAGALFLHGLLFYWLAAFVAPPPQPPSLVVEFLDFPAHSDTTKTNELDTQTESLEKIAEESLEKLDSETSEPEPLPPELEPETPPKMEPEIAETEPPPPQLESQILETAETEIFEKIEQELPDVSLNDLISEEESENLSMALLPKSQKGESLQPSFSQALPLQKQGQAAKGEEKKGALPVLPENNRSAESSSAEKIPPSEPFPEATETLQNSALKAPPERIISPEEDAKNALEEDTFPTVALVVPKNQLPAIGEPQEEGLPPNYFLKNPQKKSQEPQQSVEPADNFSSPLLPKNFLSSVPQGDGGENSATDYPLPQVPLGQQNATGMSYGLSDYNWSYAPYMGRWAKALLYSWSSHPPRDYVTGRVLGGGAVFVLVTLNLKGELTAYEVTRVEGASAMMVTSVLNAIQGASNLPPLPADFQKQELTVHFKFVYPSLYHLLRQRR